GQWDRSALVGKAEHEKIARDRISEQAGGDVGGVDKLGIVRSGRLGNAVLQLSAGECEIGVSGEVAGDRLVAVDDRSAVAGVQLWYRLGARRDPKIAAQEPRIAARGKADGMELLRRAGDAHMTVDGVPFLGEAGQVEDRAAFSLEMRG